jgi:hypothetical protein
MGSTSGHEITHPITVILDGPTSYHSWSQNMIVFLKGRYCGVMLLVTLQNQYLGLSQIPIVLMVTL